MYVFNRVLQHRFLCYDMTWHTNIADQDYIQGKSMTFVTFSTLFRPLHTCGPRAYACNHHSQIWSYKAKDIQSIRLQIYVKSKHLKNAWAPPLMPFGHFLDLTKKTTHLQTRTANVFSTLRSGTRRSSGDYLLRNVETCNYQSIKWIKLEIISLLPECQAKNFAIYPLVNDLQKLSL